MSDDYKCDITPALNGNNILAVIDGLALNAVEAEREVERLDGELKAAKERHRAIVESQLPEIMAEARQKKLTTASDLVVEVSDKCQASLPKGNPEPGIQWLRENGHAAIIRTVLMAPFEPGRDPAARGLLLLLRLLADDEFFRPRVVQMIDEMGIEGEEQQDLRAGFAFLGSTAAASRFALASTVHHQTLSALVRELLQDGKIDAPAMERLGARTWKVATVEKKGD